jgi:hypothetical protein
LLLFLLELLEQQQDQRCESMPESVTKTEEEEEGMK